MNPSTASATLEAPAREAAALPPSAKTAQTRERLLEAAGQVFAEQGYRRATVRQICKRANANVAAVSYHFGDKLRLYAAVINHWLGVALEQYPPDLGLTPDATPEQRLHAYVRSFLFRLLGQGAPAWHGRLMAQEMIDPTEVMDELLARTIRPVLQRLEDIVRDLLAPGTSEATIRRLAYSVAGQCCFYRHAEAMISRMHPDYVTDTAEIERLADHIVRFSLAGICGCRNAASSVSVTACCPAPSSSMPNNGNARS